MTDRASEARALLATMKPKAPETPVPSAPAVQQTAADIPDFNRWFRPVGLGPRVLRRMEFPKRSGGRWSEFIYDLVSWPSGKFMRNHRATGPVVRRWLNEGWEYVEKPPTAP
jgi:hypothetical protein